MSSKKQKNILVVDDEKPLAHALELKLQHSGFNVVVAYDGEQALAELKKNKFDLVLLDLMLPKIDGFGVMEELHQRKDATPIIVTSNLSQEDDAKRVKSLGAVAYLVKSDTPINKIVDTIVSTFTA